MSEKILVAMSGGVDSSVAALLLKNQGYNVTGITLLLSGNEKDATDAKSVCDTLGINHISLDMKKEFEEIVEKDFVNCYLRGETPNPCVICNREIKFGLLEKYAKQNGFDYISTGHYVGKKAYNNHTVIVRADDTGKDQSYMLWQLTEEQIDFAIFPLQNLSKAEIREIAKNSGFNVADRPDSQDICFVPEGKYAEFIEKTTKVKAVPGNFVNTDGKVIGKHGGMINFTIGQRKGLGMGFGEPMYVLDKNAETGDVTLGTDKDLFKKEISLRDVSFSKAFSEDDDFLVKIRYAHNPSKAKISICEGFATVVFNEPQRAPAKGQSAVIYKGEMLVGGGFIL